MYTEVQIRLSKGLRPHAAGPLGLEMRLRSGEVARCIGELRLQSGEVAMCIAESATQGAAGGARKRPGGFRELANRPFFGGPGGDYRGGYFASEPRNSGDQTLVT